jgi:hypothetical protein
VDAGRDAGVADAGVQAPPRPPLPVLALEVMVEGVDGGFALAQVADRLAEIDPARALIARITPALRNYRIRVFDADERVLPSDDAAEPFDGGLDYRIVLQEPLKPARAYHLMIDAQLGNHFSDLSGWTFNDTRLFFKVRGKREPEPKPGKQKKRKR